MSRFRTIQYMIDRDTDLVWSRVGSEVAIPVVQFDKMTPDNKYAVPMELEKFNAFDVAGQLNIVMRTRKINVGIKNLHRKFWGMKPLKTKEE